MNHDNYDAIIDNHDTTNTDNDFLFDNAWYKLEIKGDVLCMKCNKKRQSDRKQLSTPNTSVQLNDVISTTLGTDEWRVGRDGQPLLDYNFFRHYFFSTLSDCFALSIHYWIRLENYRRKLQMIKIQTSNLTLCKQWHEKIRCKVNECIAQSNNLRPKHLLVIVNPYAGDKAGKYLYENVVSPTFKKAEIKEVVTFTEYSGHATEYLASTDLLAYDGVVAVGGDGTFNEILNGVLINEQLKQGVPLDGEYLNDVLKPMTYRKPSFRVGLIPAGSANVLNYTSQGTTDVETALLHVICGESHPLDVTSLHDGKGKFIKFKFVGSNYGFFSENLRLSNNLRFFGRLRYKVAPLLLLFTLRCYPGEISYLLSCPDRPVDVTTETSQCRYPCSTCLNRSEIEESISSSSHQSKKQNMSNETINVFSEDSLKNDIPISHLSQTKPDDSIDDNYQKDEANGNSAITTNAAEWKVSRGPFLMLSTINTACRFEASSEGFVPSAHLADGTNDLVIVRGTSRRNFIGYLQAILGPPEKRFDFSFVEVHRIKAFRFRASCSKKEDNVKYNQGKDVKNNQREESTTSSMEKQKESSEDLKPSSWMADGETMRGVDVSALVHRGLVDIFATGL